MKNKLVQKQEQYEGLYVTTKSFASKKVMTSGKNPIDVINRAKAMGVEEPVIIYIPPSNKGFVFGLSL